MTIDIREYRAEDCEALGRLFYDTVHSACTEEYTPAELDAWADGKPDLARWNEEFLAHDTLVAEDGVRIVGFADMDANGELDRLYVHKDYQRKGIAKALCTALMIRCKAKGYTVHASLTARGFFEKLGFTVAEEESAERNGVVLKRFLMKRDHPLHGKDPLKYDRPKRKTKIAAGLINLLGVLVSAVGIVLSTFLFQNLLQSEERKAEICALIVFGSLSFALFLVVTFRTFSRGETRMVDYILGLASSVAAFVAAVLHVRLGWAYSDSFAVVTPFPVCVFLALAGSGLILLEYVRDHQIFEE